MPSIFVRNLSSNSAVPGSPSTLVKTFSDTFVRANAASWGSNYGQYYFNVGNLGWGGNGKILSNLGRMFQSGTGAGRAVFYPLPLYWLAGKQQRHFSQVVISAMTASMEADIICGMAPDISDGSGVSGFYALAWGGTTVVINRIEYGGNVQNATINTISTLSGATAVAGDVLRLQSSFAAGTWTLQAFKNGTSLGSITDATINANGFGMPAVGMVGASTTGTIDLSSFNCGVF